MLHLPIAIHRTEMAHMHTHSLLPVGCPLPSGMRSISLWSFFTAICGDAVNPSRPASGHEYKEAMQWRPRETQFACESLGDLVTLEKAKLRDDF